MNLVKFSTALTAIFAATLIGCNSEDDVIPEITPTKKTETVKVSEDSTPKTDSMPELKPIQSLSVNSSTPAETFTTGSAKDAVEPGTEGSVTIQVSIQPSKRSANAILKKLEEKGIKGYLAQVENPGELEGTYYRIRVGYFKKLEDAKAFGKNRLEPLGYAWWIDNKANDAVGSPETSESSDTYSNTPTYTEPQAAESIPTDAEISTGAEPSSSSGETGFSSQAIAEVSQPEQPAEIPQPAASAETSATVPVEQAPATATEEVYDDWE